MELRHLITFKTIVETGGFRKAADELGYVQSSITSHIKELEKELGYPLFDRLGKKVVLTQTGERYLPYAKEMIDLHLKSKEVIKEANVPAGELTIGVSESLMIYWLPAIIQQFMERYPEVKLTLKSIHDNLPAQFIKGEIDAAVLIEVPNWQPSQLRVEQLKPEKLSLVRSAAKAQTSIPETMFVTEYTCSWRPMIESFLETEGREAKRVELPSIEAIKKCVLLGLGRSMLPHFVVKAEIENGDLIEEKAEQPIAIYTAVHKDKWQSINVEAFLDVLMGRDGIE
ncbi:LysR family transcriptional regulator [Paenalkalicoccus suaedae]|uniref:LysR family transcriptional regulator n=1 Tax=Paenalkalicoccus suaedae TaxID=2592382 RepID=A0A859FIL5_9BACI|nr:LysR family transcriptional regulator [Paenalkalicoccus suaedae]QKS72594.1 LysR family transcriptional regulator [Paenalkalicoccus suaedae]